MNSREIEDKDKLYEILTEVFECFREKYSASYEIYRGDSFQLTFENTEAAIISAIAVRAKLRSTIVDGKQWDARVAVGIGTVDYHSGHVSQSSGSAFIISGQSLDHMKSDDVRIKVSGEFSSFEKGMMDFTTSFLDELISGWKEASAEAVYDKLRYGGTQKEMARRLEKSQPSISNNLKTAKYELVEAYISFTTNYLDAKFNSQNVKATP